MHGRHLGHSDWHEVTQQQIDLFAEATWDHQWIHVDPERAASGPYGGTIAHGFLTISLTPALMAEIWCVEGIDMVRKPCAMVPPNTLSALARSGSIWMK